MGCTHISHCPLFPYLNATVGTWREAYCDSSFGWKDCARFRLSRAGEPVPLALLPNGRLPVSMIPDLSRAEATERAGVLGPCGPHDGHGANGRVPVAETRSAPAAGEERDVEVLVRYFEEQARHPRPDTPPAPLRAVAGWWGRLVRHERWTRILDWLRAPA